MGNGLTVRGGEGGLCNSIDTIRYLRAILEQPDGASMPVSIAGKAYIAIKAPAEDADFVMHPCTEWREDGCYSDIARGDFRPYQAVNLTLYLMLLESRLSFYASRTLSDMLCTHKPDTLTFAWAGERNFVDDLEMVGRQKWWFGSIPPKCAASVIEYVNAHHGGGPVGFAAHVPGSTDPCYRFSLMAVCQDQVSQHDVGEPCKYNQSVLSLQNAVARFAHDFPLLTPETVPCFVQGEQDFVTYNDLVQTEYGWHYTGLEEDQESYTSTCESGFESDDLSDSDWDEEEEGEREEEEGGREEGGREEEEDGEHHPPALDDWDALPTIGPPP